jgi:energy-coupling factor transport system ATP-binding protein
VALPHEYYYASPFDLSGGEKRRVAIAGVLAMHPDMLVLDEPTAGLDPKGRYEILNQMKKLHDETGLTVVLVSHSMEDVADYVDRLFVMNKGSLVFDAPPKEVFGHIEELESMGLAVPQVTYIMNALYRDGMKVDTSATTLNEAVKQIMENI